MSEGGGALIAMSLVLVAVFGPVAFISGISGDFYRQFAVTIAASTLISLIVSLTLSPALSALLLKPPRADTEGQSPRLLGTFVRGFNRHFESLSQSYGRLTGRLVRMVGIVLAVYGGLLFLTYDQFNRTPMGFIPQLDRGYFITAFQLPPGSSLQRTDAVIRQASKILLSRPGVGHAVGFAGFDGATFTNAPNAGVIFVTLEEFEQRARLKLSSEQILNDLRGQMGALREARVFVIQPPSVRGMGSGGGFKLYVQDRVGRGPRALEQAT